MKILHDRNSNIKTFRYLEIYNLKIMSAILPSSPVATSAPILSATSSTLIAKLTDQIQTTDQFMTDMSECLDSGSTNHQTLKIHSSRFLHLLSAELQTLRKVNEDLANLAKERSQSNEIISKELMMVKSRGDLATQVRKSIFCDRTLLIQ